MFGNILGYLSKDLGIDLGTANTLIYSRGQGVVVNEPSVVAVNVRNGQILAVGHDAKAMLGKTPPHVQVTRPLQRGIIADFEVTEKMLRYFFEKLHRESSAFIPRPRVIVGVPLDVTEVERKAVGDAVLSAGARDVHLVEEPIAAAIGAGMPISDPVGNMIIDIGGGTSEIAVISLNGVVTAKSIAVAGDELNRNIMQYARDVFNLLLGEKVAEEIKINVGSAAEVTEKLETSMRGRDLLSGLPREITVNDAQIREALGRSVRTIVDHVKSILEVTPPELVADIYRRGIILTGGGALLRGIDRAISQGTGLPVRLTDDPLTSVVRGTGLLLEDRMLLHDVELPLAEVMR
ncbi:rod shape-determining protein [Candidatus Uhrbacteria bacterium RIFCSPHIGHO2_12_FULL_60_25]|uniref:Cell shape-determining protein MreB n=1 Tax=Candidatus Uhrbacteria bacterium RIFCSPHIGHO2_12_FULL_60_25 TaxID=1802399 RepID=A0A1F7UMC6_9BACT|nr:MAG: rod shape-determining protein [Candidatus Uhrbacteria bacterium RIFCSPHIGHO2_02_FULL_60_44]OGL78868.1 MAG: rod shape-determining protein [Candidatus Uhrbacteria bacterium RIFCSPHIGHO2_12_FULL_60_25]